MSDPIVLVVDDEEGIRESLSDVLSDEGYQVITAESGERCLKILEDQTPDLIFLDVWMPGIDGLETLDRIMSKNTGLPVVMISGHANIETAVKATRTGAYDFIEKPLSLERIVLVAKRAIEKKTLEMENISLRETLSQKCRLIGESPAMNAVKDQLFMAAKSSSRVMITGESGVGKEIAARMLHERGSRASAPFVEINCAAIPQELIESELFGHEKGSFTGAIEQKKGKFEMADKGTLFMDEVADMSLATQAKLLRVLETQEFQRVGGNRTIKVDVRVIAATNKNLEELIKEDKFRSDLYYRLNVIPIHMPPLRERRDDIPLLAEYFLQQLAKEYGQPAKSISAEALEALKAYHWPGNIRELKNLIERMVIMTRSETIKADSINLNGPAKESDYASYKTLREARDHFERGYLMKKLEENNFNISRTAEAIDIERSNLHKKIKTHNIQLPE